jgi:hypothetical protein
VATQPAEPDANEHVNRGLRLVDDKVSPGRIEIARQQSERSDT